VGSVDLPAYYDGPEISPLPLRILALGAHQQRPPRQRTAYEERPVLALGRVPGSSKARANGSTKIGRTPSPVSGAHGGVAQDQGRARSRRRGRGVRDRVRVRNVPTEERAATTDRRFRKALRASPQRVAMQTGCPEHPRAGRLANSPSQKLPARASRGPAGVSGSSPA